MSNRKTGICWKCFLLFFCLAFFCLGFSRFTQEQASPAIIRLGKRLFKDDRFSTPAGDLPASCSNCHMFDQDPQGLRAYADFFNRSWVSSRAQDRNRFELRNSPTLFDVAEAPR